MKRLEVTTLLFAITAAGVSCGNDQPAAAGADAGADLDADANESDVVYPPILVTAAVHMDPLNTTNKDGTPVPLPAILVQYEAFRDGMVWYTNLANEKRLRISAQTNGAYADAVIKN